MWNSLVTISVLSSVLATAQASPKDDVARIIGGTDAAPGEYPYFVQGPGCSGALIAPDIVLFAAHCENLFLNQQLNVGGYRIDSDDAGAQPRFCDVWISDDRFAAFSLNWDFALCKLDKPITSLENPKNIGVALNFDDTVPEVGNDLWVMGFGDTTPGIYSSPEIIQEVAVPYVTNEVCNDPFRYDGLITDQMLCAGFTEVGGKDACQGDSGGPIVLRTTDSSNKVVDEIVGVVSWGYGCAEAQFPGVYSRVSKGGDWIIDKTCNELNGNADFCPFPPQLEPECLDGNELIVTVKTDNKAKHTNWKLFDSSGNVLKRRKFMVNNFEYEHSPICLKPGCYEFEIKDKKNNGIAGGFYKGEVNGEEVFFGDGNFGQFGRASFCTDGTPQPTEPPLVCVDRKQFCSKLENVKNKRRRCRKERNGTKIFNLCNATCAEVGVGPCA